MCEEGTGFVSAVHWGDVASEKTGTNSDANYSDLDLLCLASVPSSND